MFSKILLPVAFNRNTRWSASKAVQLANKFHCDLHLLYILPQGGAMSIPNFFLRKKQTGEPQPEQEKKMSELVAYCRSRLKDGLLVSVTHAGGNCQEAVKDTIIAEHADLVLIPKNKKGSDSSPIRHLSINQLSQQTNCPVMTVTRNFNINQLHNIVVPVKGLLPLKKLTLATYMSIETSGCIYLMGSNGKDDPGNEGSLGKAYQLLNGLGRLNVQCALREDPDMAAGTLLYAKDVAADLIVINPGQESRLKGWWNRMRGKYLCYESDIPVMTVAL